MNLISVFRQFPDQQACIARLEQVRWGDCPARPHCASDDVARKQENHRGGRAMPIDWRQPIAAR